MNTYKKIPIFTSQLEKAREATDMANIRSAYAEVTTSYLQDNGEKTIKVDLVSNTKDWKSADDAKIADLSAKSLIGEDSEAKKEIEVKVDSTGKVTIGGKTVKATAAED